ncbi:MAG: hypothetical protein WC718_06855 [Phycisphaerales bacterium]
MTSHHANGSAAELGDGAEYDAIADLFLAEAATLASTPRLRLAQEPEGTTASPVSRAPASKPVGPLLVEGLLMGHLPVLGGAWVTQYAKHVADAGRQPVALVRVQAGTLSVDLVMPRGAPTKVNSRIGSGAQGEDLAQALMHAAGEAAHWLVRVDEIYEPELLALSQVQGVTLLTGADDAAVVASYRTIKNLMAALEAREGEGAPTLGLAIMGAGEEDASEAEQKIRKAVKTFLAADLKPAARVGRVGACSTVALYRAASEMSLKKIFDLVGQASQAASQVVEPKPEKTVGKESPNPSSAAHAPIGPAAASTPATAGTPAPAASPGQTMSRTQAAELLGLRALASECPYAPGVILAGGEGGKLHLVIAAIGAGGDCSLDEGVRRLLTAAAWADDHAGLLENAHAESLAAVRAHGPMLHVLTGDAKSARGLLDTGVKVHLVATAGTEGRQVTLTRELN